MIQTAETCKEILDISLYEEQVEKVFWLTVAATTSMFCSGSVALIMYFNK